jgi:hypothetical protein
MPRTRPKKRLVSPTVPIGPRWTWPPWASYVLLSTLFAGLAAWSWRKWPDVFVDFGHELYIPWQLAEGRVLYRDIAYFMGPLSQYFNATMFVVFGTSLTTLIFVNLTILASIVVMIHWLFSQALGRAAGLLTTAVFLCVFAFAQYVGLGNYNYVTPYLHEQTHGVALGVLLLVLLARLSRRSDRGTVAAAGAVLGLSFLTKAEAFVPALASSVTAGALLYVRSRASLSRAAETAGLFAAAACAPILLAFLLLATQLPAPDALRAVAGNWIYVFDRDLTVGDPYYAQNLGFAEASEDVRRMLAVLAGVAVFALGALAAERLATQGRARRARALGLLAAAALLVTTDYGSWLDLARILPLVCALGAAGFLSLCWKHRQDPRFHGNFILALWSVFGLLSLLKMVLRARFEHYGFALAMPGALLLVALAVFWIPGMLQRRGWPGEAWRAAALAAVAVGVGWLLMLTGSYYRMKTLAVGEGGDRFYVFDARVEPRGHYFLEALDTLRRSMPEGATLAVLPDGALLNYLLRRPNPTPYYLVTPWEMRAFGGEAAVFSRLTDAAPDFFVLAKLDMSEYGPRFFGFDSAYGARTRSWLEEHYDSIAAVGHEPTLNRPWLRIYKRREPSADTAELAQTGVFRLPGALWRSATFAGLSSERAPSRWNGRPPLDLDVERATP